MDIACFLAREYQMAQVLKRKYIDYKNKFLCTLQISWNLRSWKQLASNLLGMVDHPVGLPSRLSFLHNCQKMWINLLQSCWRGPRFGMARSDFRQTETRPTLVYASWTDEEVLVERSVCRSIMQNLWSGRWGCSSRRCPASISDEAWHCIFNNLA